MAIDWDAELLAPVMAVFGEGDVADQSTWPTYTYRDFGGSFPLAGAVFDEQYGVVDINADGSESATQRPALGVRLSLFTVFPRQNDVVTIPRVEGSFIVINVRPDGHGHAVLVLQGPLK